MKSIGCMVEKECDMWLVAPDVDVQLLCTIRRWFSNAWIARLHLMTKEDRTDMVKEMFEGCQVEYAFDQMIEDGFLAFLKDNAVVVQGAMLLEKAFATRMYAGWFGKSDSEKMECLLKPFVAKMRTKGFKDSKGNKGLKVFKGDKDDKDSKG